MLRIARTLQILLIAAALAATWVVPPAFAQSGWMPGPGAAGDNTYDGFIDIPANGANVAGSFTIAGWFVDTTAQGWAGADDVQVFLGTVDGGGTLLGHANFAQSRPDVAAALNYPFWAASGFNLSISTAALPMGSDTLTVYAHTPGKGSWFKQVTVNVVAAGPPRVTITAPTSEQTVFTNTDFTITGTATDPSVGPSGIDAVTVYINGQRGTTYSSFLGTATLNGDGTWSLTFSPTKFPDMHSNLYVYAHSKVTGLETFTSIGFTIAEKH